MYFLPIIMVHLTLVTNSQSTQPNIVIILTDDQDVALGGLTPMEKSRKLIGGEGINFVNAFVTTPICCPSRSSMLTGLYLHTHGTMNNTVTGGCSSKEWQMHQEPKTFAAILHKAGYRTFYAGKYLNRYGYKVSGGVKHVPEGWDWWFGLVGNSVYYNYTLSVNGSRVEKGDKEADYLTDVLKGFGLKFLDHQNLEMPFLMVISPPAPHEPFAPARRHIGKFSGLKAPRTPNFNQKVNATKHWLLRLATSRLPSETVDKIDKIFQNRWETLLAVDELVEAIVYRLKEMKALENTFIILTSDNGFHLGQFGQPWDKRQPYETDIRIPLLIRGPGIPKKVVENPVLSIDIAPTVLDIAGIHTNYTFDGRSFLEVINKSMKPFRSFLIEYHGEHEAKNSCYNDPNLKLCLPEAFCRCFDATNNTFLCVRHLSDVNDDIFCQFQDVQLFQEFYDIKIDPYQTNNLADKSEMKVHKALLNCCRRNIQLTRNLDECFDYRSTFHFPNVIQS